MSRSGSHRRSTRSGRPGRFSPRRAHTGSLNSAAARTTPKAAPSRARGDPLPLSPQDGARSNSSTTSCGGSSSTPRSERKPCVRRRPCRPKSCATSLPQVLDALTTTSTSPTCRAMSARGSRPTAWSSWASSSGTCRCRTAARRPRRRDERVDVLQCRLGRAWRVLPESRSRTQVRRRREVETGVQAGRLGVRTEA